MLLSYGWRWKKEVSAKKSFINLLLFLFCPQITSGTLPAFSISTEKKGKKGGRGKDRDNNACVHVYAHVKGV